VLIEILSALALPLFEKSVELYEKSKADAWTPERTRLEIAKLVAMIRSGTVAQAAAEEHAKATDAAIDARLGAIK
jgi:hypothetical protein